jgi:uroporphyrin-III C-methyltransferase
VVLVGAGPGDPELLTVKAVKALQQASVILVDDLVSQQVLDAYAHPQARIVRVGKRGGCRSTPQAFIERLMIRCALRGERVLRLKGGDPFIFGRGGEEVEHLHSAGLHVEVINGITSGLAAVSSLNTPLTHRDHAQGVVLITGHAREQGQPLDWAQLGRSAHALRLTLVIYMGMKGLADITTALQQGLPPATAALVVQDAASPRQRQVSGPLSEIAALADHAGLGSPAVVVIGDVLAGLQAAMAKAPQADLTDPQAWAA